jgi:hypothetical protein
MKIKYPLILGILHFTIVLVYLMFGFSHNFFINTLVLIFLLNLSSYFCLVPEFKKSFQFFLTFSTFSMIFFVILAIGFSLFFSGLSSMPSPIFKTNLIKFSGFAVSAEKSYNNLLGFSKIIFSYLVFAVLPSFIVLSLNSKHAKKRLIKKRQKIK